MNSNYNFLNNRLGSLFNGEENDDGKSFGFLRWCKFLNLWLLFLLANFSFAQTVTIGSGTGTNTSLPIVSCYDFTYSQQIYTAAQLTQDGNIERIRFYYNNGGTILTSWNEWTVYLGHTSKTSFTSNTDWEPMDNLTQVFSGEITPVAGNWFDIVFTTPFPYNGIDNLIVAVDENVEGYSCSAAFRSFTSGSNTGIYFRADGDNPDPTTPPIATGLTSTIAQMQVVFQSLTVPNCATSLAPTNNATDTALNSVLSWSDGGAGPTSYDVYFGASTSPAFVGNQTATTYNPGILNPNTEYFWKIVPKNSNGDAEGCLENSFTTGTELTYCTPSSTNNSTYINNFSTTGGLTNVSNLASGYTVGGYQSNYSTMNVTSFENGAFDFNLAVVGGTLGVAIWVDWNLNGVFDSTERVFNTTSYGDGPFSGTITVPSGTALGDYRMRVLVDYNSQNPTNPCSNTNTRVEVEDYKISVSETPNCFMPSSLSTSNVMNTSADLGWEAPLTPPANGYEWVVSTSATPPANGTLTTNLTASASGLSSGTLHYLHVRSACEASEYSSWATTSFTTVPSCGNSFYDIGGPSGDYLNNLNTTTTIYPANPGDGVIVTFTAFGTELCCDSLSIYDGPDATFPLIGTYAGTNSPGTVTATDPSGALTFVFTSDFSIVGLGWAADITCFTLPTDTPDYVNLQFPGSATILAGESFMVYAQVYEGGLTDVEPGLSGQADGIETWIGISPEGADASSNPNTWTTWIPATHNAGAVGNNDEYQASIGSTLPVGIYRYASRFRLNGGPFVYGGNPFNQWNGEDSNSGVLTVEANPTQCAVIATPLNMATNVTRGTVELSWTAPTSGSAPTGYKVYYGTTSGDLALMNTTNNSTFTYNVSAPAYNTTYYWRIVPTSVLGDGDAIGCDEWSFTTEEDPFAPYCSNVAYSNAVEPITLVNFAGINNATSAVLNGTPSLENFISTTGEVAIGYTHELTLKGNTGGNYTNYFRVFIDWNQDGDFDDEGESIAAGSIVNSTGLDAVEAVTTIAIPESALAGTTRMRIKKLYSFTSPTAWDACTGGGYGQSEDYTLNVVLCTPTTWYADADNDGFGNDEVILQVCTQPVGYVAVGGDCNDNDNTIYPGATEICYDGILQNCNGELTDGCSEILSQIRPYFCGTTLQNVNSSILATIPTGLPAGLAVTSYRYEITNLSTNEVRQVEKTTFMVRISETNIAQFGTAYSIRVAVKINNEWQPFGLPCEVTTPSIQTQILPYFCGTTLQNINSSILADGSINIPAGIKVGPGITGYRYEITNLSTNEVREVEKTITMVRISETDIGGFNTAYSIRVAVRVNGNWLPYGTSCVINTPSIPTTTVSTLCGQALSSLQSTIYATTVTSALGYEFEVSRIEGGVPVETSTIERSANNFKLTQLSAIQHLYATEYQVRVRVKAYVGSEQAWSSYGAVCSVFTLEAPVATTSIAKNDINNDLTMEFKAIAYPNPFANSFAVDVRTSNTETVSLTVYDMAGRLLEVKEVKASDVSNYQFGDRYPSGVYNMIVTQGEETRTVRVVKQ